MIEIEKCRINNDNGKYSFSYFNVFVNFFLADQLAKLLAKDNITRQLPVKINIFVVIIVVVVVDLFKYFCCVL
jgi:hypothetical protein